MVKNFMTRTVIFDLGEVYFTDGTRSAINAISVEYELDLQAVGEILNGEGGKQYRSGVQIPEYIYLSFPEYAELIFETRLYR